MRTEALNPLETTGSHGFWARDLPTEQDSDVGQKLEFQDLVIAEALSTASQISWLS